MSTTSASCCCEQRAEYSIYVKGSGSGQYNWNENSLNLYLAEPKECVPCQKNHIHGGVTVKLYTPYDGFESYSPGSTFPSDQVYPYDGEFIFPYTGGTGSDGKINGKKILQHFPDTNGLNIDYVKKTVKVVGGIQGTYPRTPGKSISELIEEIAAKPKFKFAGEPVPICDCFTDALYTSPQKTKDENLKAVVLQFLCNAWQVGVNADNIVWKDSIFLGKHDTTVDTLPAGKYGDAGYYASGQQTTGYWPPAQTKWATTFFLPKSWANDKYTFPTLLNMDFICGVAPVKTTIQTNNGTREVDDIDRPQNWQPWIDGFDHNTKKTEAHKNQNLRLLLGVLKLTPDGLRGYPFDSVVSQIFVNKPYVVIPGLYNNPYYWIDPDTIRWGGSYNATQFYSSGIYTQAISRILSPSTPEYDDKLFTKTVGRGGGVIVLPSEGCADPNGGCGGGPGTRYGQSDGDSTLGFIDPPKSEILPRPDYTTVLTGKARLEYARNSDSSLLAVSPHKKFIYFTVNDDTPRKCPVKPHPISGSYTTIPGGPKQIGCCCVSSEPTAVNGDSLESTGTSMCPAFFSEYIFGFPRYSRGKIGIEKNPYIRFSVVKPPAGYEGAFFANTKTYEKTIQFYSKYQPVAGCGKIPANTKQLHMSTDTVPQAWWCTDVAQDKLTEIYYPAYIRGVTTVFRFMSYRQYYKGEPAKVIPVSGSGLATTATDVCKNDPACPTPGGGTVVITQTLKRKKCFDEGFEGPNGEGPGEWFYPDGGDGTGWQLCLYYGCNVPDAGTITRLCSFDHSGTILGSDCEGGVFEWTGTPVSMSECAFEAQYGPGVNPQDPCCAPLSDNNCDQNLDVPPSASSVCVPANLRQPENNPFIAWSAPRQNYNQVLNDIGSRFRVQKFVADKDGRFTVDPDLAESTIENFTAKSYKQSLVTNLYGKQLEYGSIKLKNWTPIFESVYGPYAPTTKRVREKLPPPPPGTYIGIEDGMEKIIHATVAARSTHPFIQETGGFGIEEAQRVRAPFSAPNRLVDIFPEWPQAVPAPPINKFTPPNSVYRVRRTGSIGATGATGATGSGGITGPVIVLEGITGTPYEDIKSEAEAKQFFINALKNRKSQYPPQTGTVKDLDALNLVNNNRGDPTESSYAIALKKMKDYWDRRILYELADIFTINYNKDIKTEYYPEGIPDLQYTDVKLRIIKNKNITVQYYKTDPYEINWFNCSFERICSFEQTGLCGACGPTSDTTGGIPIPDIIIS